MGSPINSGYFTAVTAEINAATSCVQLQAIVTAKLDSILAAEASATAQLAAITAMFAGLLTVPAANPTAIVTWITSLINQYLAPQFVPATTLAAQLSALTTEIATLTSAINSKASQFTSCTITIP
jgi:hypothetical protein